MIPLICLVASITDGDTLRCADGTRIRLAGIEANELRGGGCHVPRCAAMPAREAKAYLSRLTLGKRLSCRQVGTSYRRVVADCHLGRVSIRCQLVRAGAAVEWERYRREYGLGRCA